jgi:hypothetical protein
MLTCQRKILNTAINVTQNTSKIENFLDIESFKLNTNTATVRGIDSGNSADSAENSATFFCSTFPAFNNFNQN